MSKRNIYFLIGFALSLLFIASGYFFTTLTYADENLKSVAILPMNMNELKPDWLLYELSPGDTLSDEVLVYNPNRKTAMNVEIGVADAIYTVTGDFALLDSNDPRNLYYSKWVKFSETKFALMPNEWKIVSFDLSVPEDAPLGKYEGGLVATLRASENEAYASLSSAVDVDYRVGLRLYLDLKEDPTTLITTRRNLNLEHRPYFMWMSMVTGFAVLLSIALYCFHPHKT